MPTKNTEALKQPSRTLTCPKCAQEDIHGSAEAAEQFAAYSAAWANFSTNTPTSITVEDVPWPPISKNGFLVSMAADELQTVERNDGADAPNSNWVSNSGSVESKQ
jgi:hypothetical protein